MPTVLNEIIQHNAPLPTWMRVGGRADALARPHDLEQLRDLLIAFAGEPIRILGDGANLLVDDDGVDGLVISLEHFDEVLPVADRDPDRIGPVTLRIGAGVNLPRLIVETVRDGLSGLETLAGIPATVGGAVIMNAGGAFGQIADVVSRVEAVTRAGETVIIPRNEIHFDYRHSGLSHLIITAADLTLKRLPEAERPALRDRLKEVMAYKKNSQPMADNSAGCVFKNPIYQGQRTSAGKLIDQAGCKGMTVGGACVSHAHANFITTAEGCKAGDVIDLMLKVRDAVRAKHNVELQPEVVIWKRTQS